MKGKQMTGADTIWLSREAGRAGLLPTLCVMAILYHCASLNTVISPELKPLIKAAPLKWKRKQRRNQETSSSS